MIRMVRTSVLDQCRPSSILTDRRSLNRARPPPIYLQREEAITPGVYPKDRRIHASRPDVQKNQSLPSVVEPKKNMMTKPDLPKRHSVNEYRRRTVSENHIDKKHVKSSTSQNINPLQSRLIRRSGGLKKTASERVSTNGTLRTKAALTQVETTKMTPISQRELVHSGYAQLRTREKINSLKENEMESKRTHGSLKRNSLTTGNRLPTIVSSTNLAALAIHDSMTETIITKSLSPSSSSSSSSLRMPSPAKSTLAPLV